VDWVPGAYGIIPRTLLDSIGFFDEAFFLYYEEVDLCRRIRAAGYRIRYWSDVHVVHLGGESSKTVKRLTFSSSGSQLTLWRMRSELLYYRKHHGWMGARGAKALESGWHRLRAWKNRRSDDAARVAKAEESRVIVTLKAQAWKETEGGRVSPPRPW
jgi:GT2 family glycosyltransferase